MLIISHRGNGFGFPENTVEAACAAMDAGFSAEVDVWLRRGGAVISHDKPVGGEPMIDLLYSARSQDALIEHIKALRSFSVRRLGEKTLGECDTAAEFHDLIDCGRGVVVTDDKEWLTAEMVQRAHAESWLPVLVAGHNIFQRNERRWLELYRMGVDGIMTDVPLELRRFLYDRALA